ncbi:PREDICTED: uncharacterized protein LOC108765674 [Trachymyrmex cornetzi]|uniref:uncharacterized protein LOC108765674 n=1 Tax=Trachymyrmex cornetzi TaxID=471704 RepID=UPI00084EE4F1|nr:PREDICTED: uncharacterized protein LOC108765674 [Trachymyrmex cornetzi]XP_018370000.1 PREDICTED: uncharacterized protein LOC108765674 [Trachymyrmex cornetzi]
MVISSKGMERFHIVQGTTKQDQYKQILESRLLSQVADWYPEGQEYVFMYDSASCHKVRSITAFLVQNQVPVLPWPGPDMNPKIENLWELKRIAKEIITTKHQLIDKLIQV